MNAIVLRKEFLKSCKERSEGILAINIGQFKMLLVKGLFEKSIDALMQSLCKNDQYVLAQIEDGIWSSCAYYALISRGTPRTRFQSEDCGGPLCGIAISLNKVDFFLWCTKPMSGGRWYRKSMWRCKNAIQRKN